MAYRRWFRRWWPIIAASIMLFNIGLAIERQTNILKQLRDIEHKIDYLVASQGSN